MFRRVRLAICIALLASASPALAQERPAAQPGYTGYSAEPLERPATPPGYNVQPLDRILPGIRNSRPGRFYDAEGPYPDAAGGWHYRIKWLTPEGRVVWLDADARTGRVLGPYHGEARMVMPPAGLRYYPFAPGPRGMRERFGGWRPGGWRPGRRWR